jgi:hypothetical protein
MVDKPDLGKYQPSCLLAHELVNKLSVVVGYCDLLRDHVPDDSPGQVQLRKIREMAKTMAEELNAHQCSIETLTREAIKKTLASRKSPTLAKESA